jgi:hypothetical protein
MAAGLAYDPQRKLAVVALDAQVAIEGLRHARQQAMGGLAVSIQ